MVLFLSGGPPNQSLPWSISILPGGWNAESEVPNLSYTHTESARRMKLEFPSYVPRPWPSPVLPAFMSSPVLPIERKSSTGRTEPSIEPIRTSREASVTQNVELLPQEGGVREDGGGGISEAGCGPVGLGCVLVGVVLIAYLKDVSHVLKGMS